MQRLKLRVIALALLVISTSACGFIGFVSTSGNCEEVSTYAPPPPLPSSAANYGERCAMGINPSYRATFTIAPTDLETFQQNMPVSIWLHDDSDVVMFEAEAAQMDSLLYGTYNDGAIWLEIVIDTSNPQQYPVYYYSSFID